MSYKLINGDSAEVLKAYADNTFDSVVTDPPYGIEFLGKEWDKHTGTVELWQEVFRVLKPGGHLLAFSAARTYHKLATNIEGCGFEIRDQLMWLYASGFPKAQDIGKAIDKAAGKKGKRGKLKKAPTNGMSNLEKNKVRNGQSQPNNSTDVDYEYVAETPEAQQWAGWKTALKPAHEPIVMARKPMRTSCVANVQKHGTGALNIDATRIPFDDNDPHKEWITKYHDGEAAKSNHNFDEIGTYKGQQAHTYKTNYEHEALQGRYPSNVIGEIEGYQKFFYCPKVSRKERHTGLDTPAPITGHIKGGYDENGNRLAVTLNNANGFPNTIELLQEVGGYYCNKDGTPKTKDDPKANLAYIPGKGVIQAHSVATTVEAITGRVSGNNHPTVKPVALMAYLVRLVTPIGGHVLDPFNGSGSTGMACKQEGMNYTGIDLDRAYIDISKARIDAWGEEDKPKELPAKKKAIDNELFDWGK